MTTVRRMSSMWSEGRPQRLVEDFSKLRQDLPAGLSGDLGRSPVAAAAVAVIRLAELHQMNAKVMPALIRQILAGRGASGLWATTAESALAIRALWMAGSNARAVAHESIPAFLALQHDDGAFPKLPARRMPADALVTAFVLVQLSDVPAVMSRVRLESALRSLQDAWLTLAEIDQPVLRLARQRTIHHVAGQARALAATSLC